MNSGKASYWQVHELVVIGVFAAVAKSSSILISLAGGGLNPVSLLLKNLVFTTMAVVLLHKVRKFGCLFLFLLVSTLVSVMMMGGQFYLVFPALVAAVMAEGVIMLMGGYRKCVNLLVGVGLYDVLFKTLSVAAAWLFMREQPELIIFVAAVVAIGYVGAFIGLFTGAYFVRELRHAGIIRT